MASSDINLSAYQREITSQMPVYTIIDVIPTHNDNFFPIHPNPDNSKGVLLLENRSESQSATDRLQIIKNRVVQVNFSFNKNAIVTSDL